MNLTAPASATVPCPVPTQTPVVHVCAHCRHSGTLTRGALWRVSLLPDCDALYFLHSRCLAPYKTAHGLRSVEGRVPHISRRSAGRTAVTAAS